MYSVTSSPGGWDFEAESPRCCSSSSSATEVSQGRGFQIPPLRSRQFTPAAVQWKSNLLQKNTGVYTDVFVRQTDRHTLSHLQQECSQVERRENNCYETWRGQWVSSSDALTQCFSTVSWKLTRENPRDEELQEASCHLKIFMQLLRVLSF